MNRFAQSWTQSRALAAARLGLLVSVLMLGVAIAFAAGQSAHAADQRTGIDQRERRGKAPTAASERPSFVVIQTDDQTLEQLYASFTAAGGVTQQAMPNTLELIAEKGVTFNRYYVSFSLCCPSRVSLLTGRYAHNHHVRSVVPPEGGYTGFSIRTAFDHNLATWLSGAGYRTIHIGKFLNAYGDGVFDDGSTVPPGWSAWHSVLNADSDYHYYGYRLNDNGSVDGPFGDPGSWQTREFSERDDPGCPDEPLNGKPCLYQTDVFNRIATEELAGTPPDRPFYLQLDYMAPHGDFRRPAGPEPAPRDYGLFEGAPLPHNSSQGLNEGNVNDKPRFIRDAPFLSPSEIHTYRVYYQKALESLRAVDRGVKMVYDTLGRMHRLRNTYIIFTSDNGLFYGEHRLAGGKILAYEPSTHLPLLIRGPGIKPGSTTGELAANVDIAPTILQLAGVKPDRYVDGRSLFPFAQDTKLRTRRPILFESLVESGEGEEGADGSSVNRRPAGAHASIKAPAKNYRGTRLGPYKYIEWPSGEKELYNIVKDPYERNNIVRKPNFYPIRNFLKRELERLEECRARSCREVAGKLPLTRKQQLRLKRKHERERRERERQREREREKKENRG
ncbi:MAG: sulfatase [Solirubrobacterales bacterium]